MSELRFGVQLPNLGVHASADAILDTAVLAERLGFVSVWAADHVLVPERLEDQGYGTVFECMTTLAAVAAVTDSIRIGSSILVLPQREPILAAKQFATIDQFAAGRLIAGVALGYVPEEFEYLGVSFETRGATLTEQIQLLRSLWGGRTEFHGSSVEFEHALFGPLPVQGEAVPIWIGGGSDAAIRRAARLGDAWHGARLDLDRTRQAVDLLRATAGERNVEATLKMRCGVTGSSSARRPQAEDFPRAHDIAGAPQQIAQELVEYRDAGIREIVFIFEYAEIAELHEVLERFMSEIAPLLEDR